MQYEPYCESVREQVLRELDESNVAEIAFSL